MRSAILAAPLVAAAYAATTATDKGYTLVSEISGSVTVISTYYYSNPATKYLTETNSVGVVTGMPGQSTIVTGQPHAVTSQPAVATIPAGLSMGFHTIPYNASTGLTSFTVDVLSTTTEVVGGTNAGTTSGSVFIPAGQGTPTGHGGGHQTGTGGSGGHGTQTGAAAASSSTGAASNAKVASAGMLGLGAIFAALL